MNFKKVLPHISILVFFVLLTGILFPAAFSGKVVQQPDIMNFRGIGTDSRAHLEATGDVAVWTNSSFSGMPTYIWGGAPYSANKLKPLQKYVLMLGLPFPASYYFLAFLSFFVLMLVLRINPWIGLVGALAFGLSTYNFLISEAGHLSKFLAIGYFPVIAAGTILAYRGRHLLGGLLFGLGLALDIMAGHIQMTYYMGICMSIYVLVKLIYAIKDGELPAFVKSSLILLLPLALAVGTNASKLWTSYDYMKETIRGPQILEAETVGSTTGLDKDYVFHWSHGVGESLSFIIPNAYGGGSGHAMRKDYATYKDLKQKGVNPAALRSIPSYWGAMPGTGGPIYFGAIVWLLFVLGLLVVKGPARWWLAGTTLLIVLLSFGKNLMGFNNFFYNYFPFYDKFRSVNSILSVLQFTLPLLGVFALAEFSKKERDRKADLKALYTALGITGGFVLLVAILGPSILSFEGLNDGQLATAGYNMDALYEDRQTMLRADAYRSFLFIVLAGGVLWAFLKNKLAGRLQYPALFGALAILVTIDLVGVGQRYLNSDSFVAARKYETNFEPRPVDQQILADKDMHYRVFDMSINTFNSNRASNQHSTIGGYHAAKLRRYQDIIERHLGMGNQKVLDMLNTKYLISQDQRVSRNPGAMGNAWFVNDLKMVATPDEEIAALNTIDPRNTAAIHEEFSSYVGGLTGRDSTASITLTQLEPDHLVYESNSTADQLAVFSEVIYKPNGANGWKSYIDGQEVDHIRANYILRAMKVPAGQHRIEFKFEPQSYFTGELISLICSLLLILATIAYLALYFMGKADLRKEAAV